VLSGGSVVRKAPEKIEMMDWQMAEIISQKTPAQRLAIAHAMWWYARDNMRVFIAQQNPTWTAEQVDREVAKRISHGAV
jgi:hypothetical protein